MDRAVFDGHMKKARTNIESAQVLFNNGMYDGAVSASYYAVFHTVSALLASKGMGFNKHKTVINKYNEIFVYPGLIGSVSYRVLSALFKQRLECEYDPIIFIGETGAKEAIALAQSALQDIEHYCQTNNL